MNAQAQIDRVRDALAFFLVGAFVSALALLIFWGMPVTSKDIVTYMVGQLSGMALLALGYYFTKGAGQDALDAEKSANTGKMAEAVTAAARASGVDSDTIREGDTVVMQKEPDA